MSHMGMPTPFDASCRKMRIMGCYEGIPLSLFSARTRTTVSTLPPGCGSPLEVGSPGRGTPGRRQNIIKVKLNWNP